MITQKKNLLRDFFIWSSPRARSLVLKQQVSKRSHKTNSSPNETLLNPEINLTPKQPRVDSSVWGDFLLISSVITENLMKR